jgi:hypothetical protein
MQTHPKAAAAPHRQPQAIALDIRLHATRGQWWTYAAPYVEALSELVSWQDTYGPADESAREIGLRFLCNAGPWRGPMARSLKNEIRRALGQKEQQ